MVSVSLEKIIHFKNSVNAQLEAQKVRINFSAHSSHSRRVHRHKDTSQMKIAVHTGPGAIGLEPVICMAHGAHVMLIPISGWMLDW